MAALRASGYFTEARIVLRPESKEVLELDVVGAPAGRASPDRAVLKAELSKAGFPELFKLYGQRMYLDIPRALVVCGAELPSESQETYTAVEEGTGVYPLRGGLSSRLWCPGR